MLSQSVNFYGIYKEESIMAYSPNADPWSPTVWGFSLFNPTSKIDKTSISFSMWKTTIKVAITPAIESVGDEMLRYDYKNAVNIFLTPLKAYRFAQILRNFKKDPDKYNTFGIPTPQAIITVEKPDMFNHPEGGPVISIRRVDDQGNVELSYSYECNKDALASVVGFNAANPKGFTQDTELSQDTEIDCIITQLEQYYYAMTNCQSFAILNQIYPYLDKIAVKMGVDLSGYNKRTSGFFANNSGFSSGPNVGHTNQSILTTNPTQTYDASTFQNLIDDKDLPI